MQCNYDKQTTTALPIFYKEMLQFWSEIVLPTNEQELIVWNNKNIKISNKTLFEDSLYKSNIIFIHDFFTNNRPITYAEFIQKYNTYIPARKYGNIVRVLRDYITNNPQVVILMQRDKPTLMPNKTLYKMSSGKILNIAKCKSKDFYTEFIRNKIETPTVVTKWRDARITH